MRKLLLIPLLFVMTLALGQTTRNGTVATGPSTNPPPGCNNGDQFNTTDTGNVTVCRSGSFVAPIGQPGPQGPAGPGGSFPALTGGTNNTAAMVLGTGASLSTSGGGTNAATTAAALATLPTPCSVGKAPTGILANGNSTGCASYNVVSSQEIFAANPPYNIVTDAGEIQDGTVPPGSNIITSTGHTFAGASIGMSILSTEPTGLHAGNVTFPANTTITNVSGNQITVSNNTNCVTANPCSIWVAWGIDQTTQIHNFLCDSMANLTAPVVGVFPSGMIFGWSGIGGSNANDCTAAPGTFLGIITSQGETKFIWPSNFNYSNCSGYNMGGCIGIIANASTGFPMGNCCGGGKMENLEWDGLGQTGGASACGTGTVIGFFSQIETHNLYIHDICNAVSGYSNILDNTQINYNLNFVNVGRGVACQGNGIQSWIGGAVLNNGSTGSLHLNSTGNCPDFRTSNMQLDWVGLNSVNGGRWHSVNDSIQPSVSRPAVDNVVQGIIWMDHCHVTPKSTQSAFNSNVTGSIIYVKDCQITLSGGGAKLYDLTGGSGNPAIYDLGGNTCSGACIDDTLLTTAKVTLPTGWGNTASVTAASGHTYANFSFTVTDGGTGQAANPTITVTYPEPDINTPVMSCKQVGGTGAVADLTGESGASTSAVTLTWNATSVATKTYIITCTVQGAI